LDVGEAFRLLYDLTPPDWLLDTKKFLEGGDMSSQLLKRLLSEVGKEEWILRRTSYLEEEVRFLPPVHNPWKVMCVTLNYLGHSREADSDPPKEPYIFMRFPDTLVGHRSPILVPRISKQVDHELELAVIIGKRGKYIPASKAYDYVAGYTIFNDVSFRDKRFHSSKNYRINWLYAKNLDFSAPMGPYLVTKEEVEDPHNLRITLRVNGELRQEGSTEEMIFKIPEIVEYVSNGITLKPGDVISTGTPSGTAMQTGKFLKPGDVMEGTIEKLGKLTTPVEAEE
jgi:2-keto-4-pentenoate hydratase/2-oxohepta-3-ene-1,7-dioic acid hydratase in catechol pathway